MSWVFLEIVEIKEAYRRESLIHHPDEVSFFSHRLFSDLGSVG